ncbi:MAG: hypothetical protein ABSA48_16435, partial [Terracidiphilus sp.]
QIIAFWFWQRLCRARPVLWLWNECRKRSQQRQLAVYFRRRERKMEIPAKVEWQCSAGFLLISGAAGNRINCRGMS